MKPKKERDNSKASATKDKQPQDQLQKCGSRRANHKQNRQHLTWREDMWNVVFFWSRKETNNKRSASHGPNRSLTSLLSRALPSPGYHISKQLKDMTDMAPYSASLCTVFCYRVLLVHFWLMQNLAQHSLAAPHVTHDAVRAAQVKSTRATKWVPEGNWRKLLQNCKR